MINFIGKPCSKRSDKSIGRSYFSVEAIFSILWQEMQRELSRLLDIWSFSLPSELDQRCKCPTGPTIWWPQHLVDIIGMLDRMIVWNQWYETTLYAKGACPFKICKFYSCQALNLGYFADYIHGEMTWKKPLSRSVKVLDSTSTRIDKGITEKFTWCTFYWYVVIARDYQVHFCSPPHEVRKGNYWIRPRLSVRPSVRIK